MAHSTVDRVLREFIELLHSFAVDFMHRMAATHSNTVFTAA
jgi:hypothetical protein